jgi:hypothetical protein
VVPLVKLSFTVALFSVAVMPCVVVSKFTKLSGKMASLLRQAPNNNMVDASKNAIRLDVVRNMFDNYL